MTLPLGSRDAVARAGRLAAPLWIAALGLVVGCAPSGEDGDATAGRPQASTATPLLPPLDPFPLRPVLLPELERLESAFPLPPPAEPVDAEHVRGLTSMVASAQDESLAQVALDEMRGLGDAAVGELSAIVRDLEQPDAERAAALRLMGSIDSPASAEVLADLTKTGEPAWVRTHAAWRLGEGSQDLVIPALLLRLRYETDYETVLWVADTLARFENYAGLKGAFVIWRDESRPELAQAAAERLVAIAERAGYDDAAALRDDWEAGRLPSPERSERYWLAVWRWVHHFTDFQLRAVDDARFLLSRSNAVVAERIAEALHDESLYVRLHTAQSLQRMGPRALVAGPTLLRSLAEPGVAPNAVEALGDIGYEPALARVDELARTAVELELKLASVRALGAYADLARDGSAAPLAGILAESPHVELRQAAAESLLAMEATPAPLAQAAAFVTDDRVAFESTERALRAWMARRAADAAPESDVWAGRLERWDALQPPPETAVSVEERRRIREERAGIVLEGVAPDAG